MKKIAIMQPYFLPYIGYWQLINAVDEFVVYDNIEYTKKGWFNRNRILEADHDRLFTIPIKKDSDFLDVCERYLSEEAAKENIRTLRIIEMVYKRAPYYNDVMPVIQECFLNQEKNLFQYIYESLRIVCNYLDINTKITVSSFIPIDHSLKGGQKVIGICKAIDADMYINAIGGTELYSSEMFKEGGFELKFIKANPMEYTQFGNPFVPWLSIIDVMMFNDKEAVKRLLEEYKLVNG